MAFYAVNYFYDPSTTAEQDRLRPEHRAYLGSLADKGVLRASGPLVGADRPSALLLFEADSEQAVRDALAQDPFQQGDHVAETTITEWNPVIGIFAN